MVKLATNIIAEACRVILLSTDRELREMFNLDDSKIFQKVSERIRAAHERKKEKK